MIMATISENLQILKDSTDAIKQAIIDKGGTIEGDITTWADAIGNIQTGGGNNSEGAGEEYVFTGTLSYNMTEVIITGYLNKIPDTGKNYLLALGYFTGGICYDYEGTTANTGLYRLTVDFDEPLMGSEIPAICILSVDASNNVKKHTIIPVKFEKEIGTDPV